jgi:hypothetical protein
MVTRFTFWPRARMSNLLNETRPSQKAHRNSRRFIESDLSQFQDLKCHTKFFPYLFFRDNWRPWIMWLTCIAGQDQTAPASSKMPRKGWCIALRCISPNRMVTAAIKKEFKWPIHVRQIEHISSNEMRNNPRGLSAFVRSLYGQSAKSMPVTSKP